jgi:hypothetical protein
MSEIDDLGDGETGGEPPQGVSTQSLMTGGVIMTGCLSCAAPTVGQFCANCGQKHDDMRRSVFLLGRDFVEDTFSFDGRMWRTLGLLAVSPGAVPKDYAHGKRSRFTPPVRLFLVISFLFFLTISFTNTLFIGVDVTFKDSPENGVTATVMMDDDETAEETQECGFNGKLKFFVKETELNTDKERLDECVRLIKESAAESIQNSENVSVGEVGTLEEERKQAAELTERIFTGINWTISNPREFNSAFNNWLTRGIFLMTPVLALMLTLFIRGNDALIFDHMVLSLYTHAVGFALIGVALILAQIGVPFTGPASFAAVAIYYLVVLRRAYGRGWVKTVWTAFMSGILYLTILFAVVLAVVSDIVLKATA